MKIAIYSGAIPSTTFIENLIEGLATTHQIQLFGIVKKHCRYGNPNIRIFPVPQNKVLLVLGSLMWLLKLAFFAPADYRLLRRYIVGLKTPWGERLRNWSKYGSVVYQRPDLFHVQWSKGVGEWLFLKQLFGIRLVVSFRGSHMNFSQITDRTLDQEYARILPLYDGFHAVSSDVLANAMKYQINPSKAMIIHPAVKTELLDNFSIRKRDGHTLKIISVGRCHWVKGYDVAIDACAILAKQRVDFSYTIVAGGDSEELVFQINQLGLNSRVQIVPYLPHNQVIDYYLSSDLFLLPSHAEGIANVLLEAMACGLPVISTRCGGVVDVVRHGENGWLVPIRNAPALAAQIIDFISLNQSEVDRVVVSAHQTIREQFLLPRQLKQFEELYRQI